MSSHNPFSTKRFAAIPGTDDFSLYPVIISVSCRLLKSSLLWKRFKRVEAGSFKKFPRAFQQGCSRWRNTWPSASPSKPCTYPRTGNLGLLRSSCKSPIRNSEKITLQELNDLLPGIFSCRSTMDLSRLSSSCHDFFDVQVTLYFSSMYAMTFLLTDSWCTEGAKGCAVPARRYSSRSFEKSKFFFITRYYMLLHEPHLVTCNYMLSQITCLIHGFTWIY